MNLAVPCNLSRMTSGVMLDYKIQEGNPSDKMELVPMVERFEDEFHRRADRCGCRQRLLHSEQHHRSYAPWESAGSAFPRSVDYSRSRKSDNTNDGSSCSIASAVASKPASACSNVSSYSIAYGAQATRERGSGPDLRSSATTYGRWRKQHLQRTPPKADREPPKRLARILRRIHHLKARLFQRELNTVDAFRLSEARD